MWYFAWALGVAFICCFSVLNAMWMEFDDDDPHDGD